VAINCAALNENLVESELFGALPGAHSQASKKIDGKIAAAEGGTLFLDEIGELRPTVQAKRSISQARWWASPAALESKARIAALNPMANEESRQKMANTLREIGHKPIARGGNGRGPTIPQSIMATALGPQWILEYAVSLGVRTSGYPTHYKLDIANVEMMIGIEVDGDSHVGARRAQDRKKDTKLESLGWTVLRFWNRDILTWKNTGMPTDASISTTLRQHGIHLSR
jgi:hypothetical protein